MPAITIETGSARQELQRVGALTGAERKIVVVLAISVTLWITGATVESLLQLPATLLSSAVIAIGAVALLSVEDVVDWNDLKGVNWGVFFVIGAGLTLGDALTKTGASVWFAELVAPVLTGLPYVAILAALILMAFALTQFLNNVPLGAILTPVLITLGSATGVDPVRLVIPAIFTVALAFSLPSGSARMTLIAVTGAVSSKDMIRSALWVGLPSAVVIFIFFYLASIIGFI